MLCLVQARVNSKRLPKKMLKKINGNSILEILIDRLKLSKKISEVIILTSKNNSDNPIIKICKSKKVKFYRGSLNNVAKRFYEVIKMKKTKSFMRICGDSPLIDHNLIDKAISKFDVKKYDILTNIFPRSYPKGQSIEIINSKIFQEIFLLFKNKNNKEHVTTYFYENFKKFKIYKLKNNINQSNINLSIDTIEDFNRMKKLLFYSNFNAISYKAYVNNYKKLF
jgi:spore coat polysaccharide biosynthesis protein SpsF|tara:strand:+ start:1614 stop:2285 length:672 start_codon:yes stop_codon:yes gene_type:complete